MSGKKAKQRRKIKRDLNEILIPLGEQAFEELDGDLEAMSKWAMTAMLVHKTVVGIRLEDLLPSRLSSTLGEMLVEVQDEGCPENP